MKTQITEMFDIKYPIICGAMYLLSEPKLCAAVSNAGGLGNITAGNYNSPEELRQAIQEARKLTDKPFMVGITILPSFHTTMEDHKNNLQVCIDEQVAGIEVSGTPVDKACGAEFVEKLKKAGVKLFHKVGSVRHALHAEKVGYDGIFAAGIEEGGHPLNDDVSTMILTPRMVESVSIPVVTVGGIANGRSMAAALSLGAEAVMMATRFVATKECQVHDNIKQEIIKRQENETTLICKSIGLQGRAIKNGIVNEILEMEAKKSSLQELAPLITGERCRNAWKTGDVDAAPMMMGQTVGLINDILSCEELLENMVQQAKDEINRVSAIF